MCGIAGCWDVSGNVDLRHSVSRMASTLVHRGPDAGDVWEDRGAGIAIAHRRLSVLDLSEAGRQPMVSGCGRYVVVFNGEIYNHLDLRRELPCEWRGHSDTETLLAAISHWGIDAALGKCVGMFAFALWDSACRNLVLARDRVGEKPLYFGWIGRLFAFSSELKALKVVPGFRGEVDRGALSLFMRHGYVPTPYCIYQGIQKLVPGGYLVMSENDMAKARLQQPKVYWSALNVAREGVAAPLSFDSDRAAADSLESCLRRSVRGQRVADVPLGAFLSGGIDSTTIVALMQAEADACGEEPVKTFTIGFHEGGYDEAQHAKAVAQHLGTCHTELYATPEDALAVVPQLSMLYDEPFADSSQIPTVLVANMARRYVTVALSGDAGDELFGGYNRYFLAAQMWRNLSRIPLSLRRVAAGMIRSMTSESWNTLISRISPIVPARFRVSLPGDKLYKGAGVLACADEREMYLGLVSHWNPDLIVIGGAEPPTVLTGHDWPSLPSLVEQMMLLDTISYLRDDILVKVDRAAMGVSLETRVPFLDHRVIEFAWRLPLHYKVREGVGKWLVRQVLYRYVPQALVDRPKMGFGVPIDIWLRGSLRDWAEALLDEERLKREGFFNPDPIREKWQEHLSGRRNWQYLLWNVLMFQAWLEANR